MVEYGLASGGGWSGGGERLWFLGDYLDRGPDGLGVVDFVRRLEIQARSSGGQVTPLLGNHELQFLAALHFSRQARDRRSTSWLSFWRRYGGNDEELRSVTDEQVQWLSELPLIDLDDDTVMVHSDSDGYAELGTTAQQINEVGRSVLAGRSEDDWTFLHQLLTRRGEFRSPGRVSRFLRALGARRVVHGHSTLGGVFGLDPVACTRPYVYADGRATAIDGGVFEGGSLIVAEL